MSYVVFARKYRPANFDEIIGQEHITTTLKNAIKQDRVAHAYLFSGPRGVGKTTTARALAKALNCQKGATVTPCGKCVSCQEISSASSMDVIEIDGASNRGIDEVRQLRENVKFSPAHGRYKLYIIDEVHMLTQEAFNALLKTLEEPPPHVKFIFATTQPNKVIATISSRCQRFDFRKISTSDIVSKLKEIAKDESIKADEEAFFAIAKFADGSLRDAESIFDQLSTFCAKKITKGDISNILGSVSEELLDEFVDIIIKKDAPAALAFTERIVGEGKDLSFFLSNLIEYFRNLLVAKVVPKPEGLIEMSKASIEGLVKRAGEFTEEEIFYISNILISGHDSMKRTASSRTRFELAVVKVANRASLIPLSRISDRIEELRDGIANGNPGPARPAVKPKSTPPPAPAPAATPAPEPEKKVVQRDESDDIDTAKIEEVWTNVLRIIKSKKMSVASYLLEGNIVSYGGGLLTLAFAKNYTLHKEALERQDNRRLIESTLQSVLQRDIRVAFVTQDIDKDGDTPDRRGAQEKRTETQTAIREPAIQSALEVFDGRIVRKNRG